MPSSMEVRSLRAFENALSFLDRSTRCWTAARANYYAQMANNYLMIASLARAEALQPTELSKGVGPDAQGT